MEFFLQSSQGGAGVHGETAGQVDMARMAAPVHMLAWYM
jgi:hypothetical protein